MINLVSFHKKQRSISVLDYGLFGLTVMGLSIGTPKNNKFSICPSIKKYDVLNMNFVQLQFYSN